MSALYPSITTSFPLNEGEKAGVQRLTKIK